MANPNAGEKNPVLKLIILMVFAAMLALGVFMALNRSKGASQSDEEDMVLTPVQMGTSMDLQKNYPKNERAVVSAYLQITKALYNEQYSEKEFDEMEKQLVQLYDEEFLKQQSDYPAQLKKEVDQKKKDGYTISNFVVAEKDDVNFSEVDGKEMAGLQTMVSMRYKERIQTMYYNFVLRKAENGQWKIVGWEKTDQSDMGFNAK